MYCATSIGRIILIQSVRVKYSYFLTPDLDFPSKYNTVLKQPTIVWYHEQDELEYFKEPDSSGLNASQ